MTDLAPTEIPDLGAVIYPAGVPRAELDALPALYGNVASTEPYFRLYHSLGTGAACVLHHPHHVLVFQAGGHTVEILNRACRLSAADLQRACAAVFRALPEARRIHVDLASPPGDLAFPIRVLSCRDMRVIELPGGPEEYVASLGKHTRRNLRSYERRWAREHPASAVRIVSCAGHSEDLFERFRAWKCARLTEKCETSYWEDAAAGQRFTALLEAEGEAQIVEVDGQPAGVSFFFHVGDTLDSEEAAYDTRYQASALGTLMHYWVALEAARRGCARVCLGTGPNEYFRRFGSTPLPVARIAVFRDGRARLDALEEAAGIVGRRMSQAARTAYRRAKRKAGTVTRKTPGRRRDAGGDA